MSTPVIKGYYRYTDIWFEWPRALPNPEDGRALKAILAHDSLVHPDHPLHQQGVKGVEMFLGTFPSGESRLLFSSAQVDYLRYWLRAMKFTKEMIPLPYSDCLLTESNLRYWSPVVYPDGWALKCALKQIDKNNKKLKGSNPSLTSRRHVFERVRAFWYDKLGVWCAVDFEGWELDHTVITEFGWSLVGWKNGEEILQNGHLIVSENQKYTNHQYVPNEREHFTFGTSEVVDKKTFKSRIHDLVSGLSQYGPVFLVFHDNSQDLKYLRSLEVSLHGLTPVLPDVIPAEGLFLVDSSDLFGALEGEGNDRKSLESVCRLLRIPTKHLHNAGNDAHYTMLATKEMASGEPVDTQREQRWPNRTGMDPSQPGGVKVQFHPWEEDSELSDEEGLFPPIAEYDPVTGDLIVKERN